MDSGLRDSIPDPEGDFGLRSSVGSSLTSQNLLSYLRLSVMLLDLALELCSCKVEDP